MSFGCKIKYHRSKRTGNVPRFTVLFIVSIKFSWHLLNFLKYGID
ncbi:hypothetical protein HMPREF9555_02043 [Selenomonas artemidis F0399]|uniref:Uncharacterized protein n=1 Tax=Selenomonas artemidis F0399 TaxID=749551 RepID=E7N4U8_9FIRM|nr:hypothetical protein HMPREF9555_02043 [Selenomonas artemidis F0399]